jgi:hypothetical protein
VEIPAFKLFKPNALIKGSVKKHSIPQPMKHLPQLQCIEVVPKLRIPRKELYMKEPKLFRKSLNSKSMHTVKQISVASRCPRKALLQNHTVSIP